MALEVTGTIHDIAGTVDVSDRFRKREFVVRIADNPKYPQLVQFQATGDRCPMLDEFEPGDEVRVEFRLKGREWKSPRGEVKFFNTLDVWLVTRVGQQRGAGGQGARPQHRETRFDPPPPSSLDDDIPFATCSLAAEPSAVAAVLRRPT